MRVATVRGAASKRTRGDAPDIDAERRLCAAGRVVAGMDEVGRGAWAGPVVVGVVVVHGVVASLPCGVRDSKELTADARSALAPQIRAWCRAWSLGSASAAEIDVLGIVAALTAAARRALAALPIRPDVLLLDGGVDFVSKDASTSEGAAVRDGGHAGLDVRTYARGDAMFGTIAAAAILAKVGRDEEMERLAEHVDGYGFDRHKGYGTRAHESAIRAHGLTVHHRRSWGFVDRLDADADR